ncbi:MAG: hypothetical protein IPQ00_00295 [Chloracidobacterium sp.]|nr:hypothetical protein [Chloracidobacterium sp.]
MAVLRSNNWLGNVRELKNTIERVVIMSAKESVTPADLRNGGRERTTRDQLSLSNL